MNNILKILKKEKILFTVAFLFILITFFFIFLYKYFYSPTKTYADIYINEIYTIEYGNKKNILNDRFNKYLTREIVENIFLDITKKNPNLSEICSDITLDKNSFVYKIKLFGTSVRSENKKIMQIECINKFVKELTNLKKEFFNTELKDNLHKTILLKEYLSSTKSTKKQEIDLSVFLNFSNILAYNEVYIQIISLDYERAVESITQPFIYKISSKQDSEIKFYFFIIFSYILFFVLFFFLRKNLKNIFQ
jgi:hypothetical protein